MYTTTVSADAKKFLTILCMLATVAIVFNPYPGIDIAILVTVAGICAQVFWQEKLLLALLLLRPAIDFLRDMELYHYRSVDINLTAVISLMTAAWLLLMTYRYRHHLTAPGRLLGVSTLLLAGISILWSVAPGTTIIEILKLSNTIGLFFITYIFVRDHIISLPLLEKIIIAAASIPAAVGFFQLITNAGITTFDVRDRIYGTVAHPNILAFILFLLLVLFIERAWIRPTNFWQINRNLCIPTLLLLLILLASTYTRVALLGVAIFLVTIGVLHYRRFLLWFVGIVAVFYLSFYPINAWLIDTFNYRLTSNQMIARLTTRDEDADSISWRIALVQESIPLIAARPILGYGFGTFPLVWEAGRGITHIYDDSAESHNDYLRLAVELGGLGLLTYTAFWGLITWHTIQHYRRYHTLSLLIVVGSLVAFLAMNISDNMLHHTPAIWLLVAFWGGRLGSVAGHSNDKMNFV